MKTPNKSPQQGTLWGSNSPSIKRLKTSNESATTSSSGWGDFGRYMEGKQRKLREQFQAECSKDKSEPDSGPLFKGISIFVNGYTIPSHQELRSLMLNYGGTFENYFSRQRVTHIICSNLPNSKIKEFRSFSKGLPVVKPEWIVESIAAGRVLHWTSFQLEKALHGQVCIHQRKLSSFFACGSHYGQEKSTTVSITPDSLQGHHLRTADNANDEVSSRPSIGVNNMEENAVPPNSNATASITENEEALDSDNETGSESGDGLGNKEDARENGRVIEENRKIEGMTGRIFGDANFVQNYFKYSRLHFIGTWRNRYQGRTENLQGRKLQSVETGEPCIIHIDMDCFFVSVVARKYSEKSGKPLAVCHSDSSRGTAEISSANYEARAYGVKAGMFFRDAKALCPNLEILPYDFEGYEEVAEKFYDILHQHSDLVQAVSCDEAYVDVTGLGDPDLLASTIRREIYEQTKCIASAGIAANMLLARLATKKAKPNGQYHVHAADESKFIEDLPVDELPGVGWSLQEKLLKMNVLNCRQLRDVSKEVLQREFGLKTGEMLWLYSRGIDHRKVQTGQGRKSIGAEVNWGVRFTGPDDAQQFLIKLTEEVSARLGKARVCGRTFTLKVKKRKEGAEEPVKFMGCGSCDNISRSATLPMATDKCDVLLRITRQIFASLCLDVREVRGLGLQVSKLEPVQMGRHMQNLERQRALDCWLLSGNKQDNPVIAGLSCVVREGSKNIDGSEGNMIQKQVGITSAPQHMAVDASIRLPSIEELDASVLKSLPVDIFHEINNAYNGALVQHVMNLEACENTSALKSCSGNEHAGNVDDEHLGNELNRFKLRVSNGASTSLMGKSDKEQNSHIDTGQVLLSLTQIDKSVLEELPMEVQHDILQNIPRHRPAFLNCNSKIEMTSNVDKLSKLEDKLPNVELWNGQPPAWVRLFDESKSRFLKMLSKSYVASGYAKDLSSFLIFLKTTSLNVYFDMSGTEDIVCCTELIKQYLHSVLPRSLEEVYLVIRSMKRLSSRSHVWCSIEERILPDIQAKIMEIYGGVLRI